MKESLYQNQRVFLLFKLMECLWLSLTFVLCQRRCFTLTRRRHCVQCPSLIFGKSARKDALGKEAFDTAEARAIGPVRGFKQML